MSALLLPQSTAFTFRVGPFLDSTDGKTRKTALTIGQASRLLSKNGAAYAQQGTTGDLAHSANGYYTMVLTTGDTDTLGSLELDIDIATALVVTRKWQVVPQDTYNALVAGSGAGVRANMTAINGLTAAAVQQALAAGAIGVGTVDNTAFTATATQLQSSDLATAGVDHFKSRTLIFTSGSMAKQAVRIDGYSVVSGRGQFVYTAANAAPANGTTFIVV